ncbi:MAG: hypothetical protein ACRDIA_04105, partial [Actinomycetota bacterium]
ACTAQTRVIALSPQAGPVGSQVVIKGEGVAAGSQVDIRWNGLDGAKLAEVGADASGYFSATVTIPASSSEVNFLMAVGSSGVARAPFTVTTSAPAAETRQAADLWSGFGPSGDLGALDAAAGSTDNAIPQAAMMTTVVGLGLGAFAFGLAAGARRRRRAS